MNDTMTEAKWYVVHTYSGYENKVKTNLEKIIENRKMSHLIMDIQVPVETVMEIDGEKQKEVDNKIFPSYVLIKMIMTDESWHVVRNIRGVTGFVGPGSKPIALTDDEVKTMGIEATEEEKTAEPQIKLGFGIGDTVQITGGLLKGSTGIVENITPDCQKVTVTASMFGRDTSIELDVTDVQILPQ